MYDISTKNVRKGKGFYYIFLAAGLLFLIILCAVLILSYSRLKSLDSTTTSTRVIINSHEDDEGNLLYSPTYYYSVDGEEYLCKSNVSSSIRPGAENKKVYYDSKNPSKCMTEYSKSSNKFLLIFFILPLVFIIVAVVNIRKVNKRVKLIKQLNENGKLVKNLPYHLENTGMVVNNIPIQRPVVEYTLPNGSTITLFGDPRNDRKSFDSDGMVDLVIDENNPDNYFIDFEINRLTGNLPSDYYNYSPNNMVDNSSYQQQNTATSQPEQPQPNQNINQFNGNNSDNLNQNNNSF